ncbi:MAG: hypothetical protein LBT03_03210 [Holosporales bacterium]|jgi:glucose-6-phosphate isomerase|nr:hypothetical protein [Holosporales bacterium]
MIDEVFNYIKVQIRALDIFKVLDEDRASVRKLAKSFDCCNSILVIGTGGSSLGGKCLVNFEAMYSGKATKVVFLENTDSRHFENVMRSCDPDKTGIIVISKSGKTTESLMLFSTICELWPNFDYQTRALAITEFSENSTLRQLAKIRKMRIVEHNPKIGGRFSVFSVVGLLPAILGNVDIDLFIEGARKVVRDIEVSKTPEECKLFNDICSIYKVFANGEVNIHVLMVYSDLLEDYGKWFIQLVSESLGKTETFGITPVRAIGTVDQHSMLQLFLGGPADKLFTVIVQKRNNQTSKVTADIPNLKGHNIQELMLAHQNATIEVLREKASVRVLEFEEFTIETLGFLMMLSFIEVIAIAKLAGINPFDQPAVEKSKKLVIQYLSAIH